MPRVLVIVPFPMSEENRLGRASQLQAVKLGPDISFDFRPVRAAPANDTSEHDAAIADLSIVDAGKNAQTDGFDAVCIDTMSDSGVAALRSMLDIPVIGPGRASMMTALMLGDRFSILIMWDRWRHLYKKTINELGHHDRCASVRSIGVTPNNQSLLAGKEDAPLGASLSERGSGAVARISRAMTSASIAAGAIVSVYPCACRVRSSTYSCATQCASPIDQNVDAGVSAGAIDTAP
jgi:allantoin racemase